MDPTVILQILITALTTLLENCKQPEKQKAKFLKNPGPIDWLRLEVQMRHDGATKDQRKAAHAMAKDLQAKATDSDRIELIRLKKAA